MHGGASEEAKSRKSGGMVGRSVFVAGLASLALLCAAPALAQSDIIERLTLDRLAAIQPGLYVAGDRVKFQLGGAGHNFLLRFEGNPEIFVLYSDRTSLGSRELKYDSGETAIRVAGWGGVTLYTDSAPNGLPAVRLGDSAIAPLPPVALDDIQSAAADEGQHLGYTRRLRISFTADWSVLEANPELRSPAFDAMENAARGIDRFTRSGANRDVMASRIETVALASGMRPTIKLQGKTLIVTFNPDRGYVGRASSRAIARALGSLFGTGRK